MSAASTDSPPPVEPRTLVLVFDGTANEYNKYDTNAVKFFGLLKKDDWRTQLCYYQSGIGTYFNPSVVSPLFEWCAKILDMAIAFYLDQHVMDGYRFLMENYHAGDRICLFGFSRGAYTARALAGMLHKVGLLPRSNAEQLPFAFKMYTNTSDAGVELAAGYKTTFCQDVKVHFLGCWDTVASVGVVTSRTLPFTATNTSIKTFRHALALDERRVRFQPLLVEPKQPPFPDEAVQANPPPGATGSDHTSSDTDEEGDTVPDVLEVWFVGCHSDIGGGNEPQTAPRTLADITLRWMVRHVEAAGCSIRFDEKALVKSQIRLDYPPTAPGVDVSERSPFAPSVDSGYTSGTGVDGQQKKPERGRVRWRRFSFSSNPKPSRRQNRRASTHPKHPVAVNSDDRTIDVLDATQPLYDSLTPSGAAAGGIGVVAGFFIAIGWNVLEGVPMLWRVQDTKGGWVRKFGLHLRRGRTVIDPAPNFHVTVKERMQVDGMGYTPRALWTAGTEVYVE